MEEKWRGAGEDAGRGLEGWEGEAVGPAPRGRRGSGKEAGPRSGCGARALEVKQPQDDSTGCGPGREVWEGRESPWTEAGLGVAPTGLSPHLWDPRAMCLSFEEWGDESPLDIPEPSPRSHREPG